MLKALDAPLKAMQSIKGHHMWIAVSADGKTLHEFCGFNNDTDLINACTGANKTEERRAIEAAWSESKKPYYDINDAGAFKMTDMLMGLKLAPKDSSIEK